MFRSTQEAHVRYGCVPSSSHSVLADLVAAPSTSAARRCTRGAIILQHQLVISALAFWGQEYPGHVVMRLGQAVLKLCSKANAEALAELTPTPRQLGALGLFKGLEAVAKSLTKMDAKVHKVPYTSSAPLKI